MGEELFAFRGVFPPGEGFATFHKADDGDVDIQQARVLSNTGKVAGFLVEEVRVLTDEVLGLVNTNEAEVRGDRFTHVGQVFETG